MDFKTRYLNEDEKPLDTLVQGYSHTSIFRSIAVVGDSLSSGEFESRDENGKPIWRDKFEYSWGQYIARKNGSKVYNFSRGGLTANKYCESYAVENGFWDNDKACQAYIIALGVNDMFHSDIEIGSITDIDKNDYNQNKSTFAGYYGKIIQRYKKISPDAKFFFVTLPNDNRRDQEKLKKVNELFSEMAEFFENSYVIDLCKYAPVYDEKMRERFFLYGHMSPSGYIMTAELIDSYIDYIVRHNYDDFRYVGLIGTDVKF